MKQTIQIELSPESLKAMISEAVSTAIADLHKENNKKYLTIDDLCEMFHVIPSTIHNWVNKGILKVYKISDRTLFKVEEVDQAVKEKIICKNKHTNR